MRQPPRYGLIADQRAIIDRRTVAEQLQALAAEDLRNEVGAVLRDALDRGREEIARRFALEPGRGRVIAASYCFLSDQIVRLAYDVVTQRIHPRPEGSSCRLSVVGLGGTGRGEMAPFSDLDLMFLVPERGSPWCEQVAETLLYILWDLKLKVGQSVRTPGQVIDAAKADVTVRTALLEARWIWGDEELHDSTMGRFKAEVVAGSARDYVAAKLAERDARHQRMGDSRYVVEPNVKDGKGGLRDLHTLYWIGQYVFGVERPAELVDKGLFSAAEFRRFEQAERFLWSVRCHLHLIAGRADERLGFDMQRQIAEAMRYADRAGKSAVERFMQFYFLNAKAVGDLTGLFLAQLDEQMGEKGRRFALPTFRRRPKRLAGFTLERGRLSIPNDRWFAEKPERMIELFALAAREGLEIHPNAMRAATRDARLVDKVRDDSRANALFLEVLTARERPDVVLRWMNEAGVFGRFVPDFGRVVAQMQFDMYHHYTVDEHSIRAIGLLSRIERGELADDHPLSTALFKQIESRRVLYVAVLLHDIAKGRGGDHSVLGAEVAEHLCPRLGLTPAETETVAWLVRHHLLMSATAFKRDLADYKTILDFVDVVQSPERLRLLLCLTVVDIRAVGPGVWNSWKRQLLSDLYEAAEEVLRLGHKQKGRSERVMAKQEALRQALGMSHAAFQRFSKRLPESYWIAEPEDILIHNARHILESGDSPLSIAAQYYPQRGATLVTVYAADHPGLFYRIAGAIHLAGGNIIDARIHTTRDGVAIDNFLVQDPLGGAFHSPDQLTRIRNAIEDSLANRHRMITKLEARPLPRTRAETFRIEPNVLIDNKASNRFTVIEVNARDRPALLFSLANALFQSKVTVHSAHVATYGERAVDTFYVTDLLGGKIESKARLQTLERRLLQSAGGEETEALERA